MENVIKMLKNEGFKMVDRSEFCWYPKGGYSAPIIYVKEFDICDRITVEVLSKVSSMTREIVVCEASTHLVYAARVLDAKKTIFTYSEDINDPKINKLCNSITGVLFDTYGYDIQSYETLKLSDINKLRQRSVYLNPAINDPMYSCKISDRLYDKLKEYNKLELFNRLFDIFSLFVNGSEFTFKRISSLKKNKESFTVILENNDKRVTEDCIYYLIYDINKSALEFLIIPRVCNGHRDLYRLKWLYDINTDKLSVFNSGDILCSDEMIFTNQLHKIFDNIVKTRIKSEFLN